MRRRDKGGSWVWWGIDQHQGGNGIIMVLCFGLMIPSRLWCMRRLWHDEWRRRIGPNGFNMDRLLEVEDLRNRGGKGGGKRRRRGGRGDWSQNRRSMQPWRPAGEKPKCVKFASSLQEEREMTLQCYGMLVWAGPRVKDAGCRFCAVGHNACRRRGRRSKPPLRRYVGTLTKSTCQTAVTLN